MLKILDLVYHNKGLYMKRKYNEYIKMKEFYQTYNKGRDYRYGTL